MKKVKTSLEQLSKNSLIENLMMDSIKGGCCSSSNTGSTFRETTKSTSRGIIVDTSIDADVN